MGGPSRKLLAGVGRLAGRGWCWLKPMIALLTTFCHCGCAARRDEPAVVDFAARVWLVCAYVRWVYTLCALCFECASEDLYLLYVSTSARVCVVWPSTMTSLFIVGWLVGWLHATAGPDSRNTVSTTTINNVQQCKNTASIKCCTL